MKKIVLTLMMSLALGGWAFSQNPHWTPVNSHAFDDHEPCYAFVQVEGDFVAANGNWENIEVAAFVGDELRGTGTMVDETNYGDPYPYVQVEVFYHDNETSSIEVSFRMYDHASSTEYGSCISSMVVHLKEKHEEIFEDGEDGLVFNFVPGFSKEILGYGEGTGMWYLIASPVGTVNVLNVTNILENNFDLYYFDQAASDGLEWINYNQGAGQNPGFTQLMASKGYLYANSQNVTLTFNGTTYNSDKAVTLSKAAEVSWSGWNLVGNPFAVTGYIDRSFYTMNEGGTDLISEPITGGIPAMEGVFVLADTDNEEMTFTTTAPNQQPALALNLSRDSKVVDRAVVSFGQERTLPKFQLNPNHTKVYIPQENRDYAVVTAGEMGEMPVGFKAERNGRYTLDFTAREVSFAYLHLIDNKTGKDVDLLESPAYSFDALTTDYASRFKLVFATGNATDDNFAFNSNGLWIISNEGEATLQVIDVTGRILSSETISGSCSKAISAAPGVYMLRLINGDNMKVQKVVVK